MVGLGRRAEPWECSESSLGGAGGPAQVFLPHPCLSPLKKIPTARFRGQLLSPVAPVVPPERPVGDTEAPSRWKTCSMDATWASSRSPVGPAGSYHCHGLRHSPGTCAAGSPLARPWGRAFPSRVGQTLQPRIAPPRPTDATHPPSIAGGAADPNPTCGRAAGHASGFGQGALGTGARRDRTGAPRDRATPLR